MASSHLVSFVFVLCVAVIAPTITAWGKVHIVGDDAGWKLNFDYQAWAYGKTFHVGDKLGTSVCLYIYIQC